MLRWWIAQTGLFLTVFAVVGLSGPGRIDIVDGQTRYEVARSLVDHGDLVIRDPNVWFGVFPGRDGQRQTKYRFPQSAIAIGAILTADATGPLSEARRHFFFVLTSAVASAFLAVTYAALFRNLGHQPRVAVFWAMGGIFCTPSWFYATSTFDDILGSMATVLAVAAALTCRRNNAKVGAIVAGLALGLAFNCKEPLGIFVLPVLAVFYDPYLDWRLQGRQMVIIVGLLVVGVAVYKGYDLYKFPPGSIAGHAEIMKKYIPFWSGNPEIALLAMLFSLSMGVLYYNPPIMICLFGLRAWSAHERLFCQSFMVAVAIFVLFISLLTFFKGDPAWGPRYLTPIFAVLWIFAPSAFRSLPKKMAITALGLGALVQISALCIDPHRLYIERSLPSAFYVANPGLYFHPALSHLLNRPREIVEVLSSQKDRADCYSPSPTPTFAFPVTDFVEKGPAAIQKYHVLKGFRFWWASFLYLDRPSRPVAVGRTTLLLSIMVVIGLVLQLTSTRTARF